MSERKVEVKGQGHMVSIKGLSKTESLNLHVALTGDGVIDALLAVGQTASLSPAHRQLARLLEGVEA